MKPRFNVGQFCKCLHPYAFRGEDIFRILEIDPKFKASDGVIRASYITQYADGKQEQIPVLNEGGYEMVAIDVFALQADLERAVKLHNDLLEKYKKLQRFTCDQKSLISQLQADLHVANTENWTLKQLAKTKEKTA